VASPSGSLSRAQAAEFAERWLPAWTGNNPERLISFYDPEAFYSDPAVPEGVRGREAILAYFRALLARFPDWEWRQTEATPMEGGFLNHWLASVPVGSHSVEMRGVCTVVFAGDLIARNEVFFDRTELLAAL
jgi:SnoaL-like domain